MRKVQSAIIVDDHSLARMAIRSLLEMQNITITHEFENGRDAFNHLKNHTTDLVIVDVEIPGFDGVELVSRLHEADFRGLIIVVSAKNDRYYSKLCAQVGAHAFISKQQDMDNIHWAIEAARRGFTYYPYFGLNKKGGLSDNERLESLSSQEMKVISYLLKGLDNAQIGEAMHISTKTVSTYKTRLMDKLGCNTLIELLAFASQNQLS